MRLKFSPGYYISWSGQFEYLERAEARLKIVVPATLMIIFLLLYLNFRRFGGNADCHAPCHSRWVAGFCSCGGWVSTCRSQLRSASLRSLAYACGNGGVIMLIYLDHAMTERINLCQKNSAPFNRIDLHEAIMIGAVERVRPKMMTVIAIMAGLLPILWSSGAGSEIMQRIAVPMIGGMVSSTVLTLIDIPAIYGIVKGWRLETESFRQQRLLWKFYAARLRCIGDDV